MTLISFQFTDNSWWFQYLDNSDKKQEITFTSKTDAKNFSDSNNFGLNFDGCPI